MNSMTGYGFKETIVENTQISVNVNIPSFLKPL